MELKNVLKNINESDHRTLDSHPKRSSVAIVIQVPGHAGYSSFEEWLENLPSNPEAQLLFIKRAANPRDRWSGHVALPGGRRDPSDTSDRQTAERETLEEVGVNLVQDGFYVGALDQRLLKVSWGRKVAMVLCPHIFVLNRPVKFQPQWSEVGSVFWYSLDNMLRDDHRSYYKVPIGDRLDLSWMGMFAPLIKVQLGSLQFPAVELRPEEQVSQEYLGSKFQCWGVTLGVLTDLFEMLRPGHIDSLWLPTCSAWDMRFWIWLYNRKSLKDKRLSVAASIQGGLRGGNMDLMNKLLDGHFINFPRAIGTCISIRIILAVLLILKWRQRCRGG